MSPRCLGDTDRSSPAQAEIALAMEVATSPARRCREKRLSHEVESGDALFPTAKESAQFCVTNRAALLATFVLALVWFGQIVAPLVPAEPKPIMAPRKTMLEKFGLALATGTSLNMHLEGASFAPPLYKHTNKAADSCSQDALGMHLATGIGLFTQPDCAAPPAPAKAASSPGAAGSSAADVDIRAFVAVCALVHTLIVGFGLAFGSDSTAVAGAKGPASTLLAAGGTAFVFLCAALYLSWEYNVGPVPAVCSKLFAQSEAAYVLVGAASSTAWLCVSMLLEATGARGSPTLCGLTAVGGGVVLAVDASVAVSLSCLVALVGGLVGSALWFAAQERQSGRRPPLSPIDVWNL